MMPFSSSLSKYVSDMHEVEKSDAFSPSANNLENRSSPLSSFEIISCSSVDMYNLSDHPLLSEREAIKIKAQVCWFIVPGPNIPHESHSTIHHPQLDPFWWIEMLSCNNSNTRKLTTFVLESH